MSKMKKINRFPGSDQLTDILAMHEAALEAGSSSKVTVVPLGRRSPCPCGSGKKYKKCCLDKAKDGEKMFVISGKLPLA